MTAQADPAQHYEQPFGDFPARGDHDERWAVLGRAIAAGRGRISDDPAAIGPPAEPGELTVIGSGIETVGFTAADETLIRDADEVFFCVADPATSVWIKARRPDAYDLYVLYDDSKLRYLTYMQMTEAMLHYVRQGRKVVAIFYGHPGIFVLSTHRAVIIARREGHRAVMRAAVSALDALCADLGVDPSQPGLQTFEATDMLVRRRRIDPCMHLVVWQVGLVGELGYRRQGYLNSGFSVLLDYLEEVYGAGHTIVNYVASRYPGIEPLADSRPLAAFRDPDAQAKVTGISTFYLPPKEAAPADEEMLTRLGLLPPGATVRATTSPLREIDRYGPRELKAFDAFARFRVPAGYHWQEDTAAARFALALRDDRDLRERYVRDPAGAVAGWGAASLDRRERDLLGRRDPGALQIAAKGVPAGDLQARPVVAALLTSRTAARELVRAVRRGDATELGWASVERELHAALRTSLYPWTGLYLAPDRQTSLFLLGSHGRRARDRAYLNGQELTRVRYTGGTLRWRAEDGNPCSGYLRPDLTPHGARRLTGVIWPPGETAASADRLTALEHLIPAADRASGGLAAPGSLPGEYLVRVANGADARLARFSVGPADLLINAKPAEAVEYRGSAIRWRGGPGALAEGTLTGITDPITRRTILFGTSGFHQPGSHALTGSAPISADEAAALAATPGLAVPDWAWAHLVAIAAGASRTGGLFLWHRWQRAATNLRLIRAALAEAPR
jgi:Tetrapyrrole (Corrin/Porphyrin) Methylases